MPDRRPGYTQPAWRILPDPEPFAGMDHAALVAVNKANAAGRLLAEAEVERLMQHLDHKPVPAAYDGTELDYLVDRRRRAEGADMPADDDPGHDWLPLGWTLAILSAAVVLYAIWRLLAVAMGWQG